MSFDYSSLNETSVSLLANFGRDVAFKHVDEGSYNFSLGTVSSAGATTETVKAVFVDYKKQQIDGTIVQRGDKMALVSSSITSAPKINDIIDGYKVIAVDELKPGDTTLLYKLQVRR